MSVGPTHLQPLTRDVVDECFRVASSGMEVDEPINYCVGLSGPEFLPFLQAHKELLFSDIVNGISSYVCDKQSGKVVGGFFFVDLFEEMQILENMWTSKKFEIVEEAMGCIHKQYESYRKTAGYSQLHKGQILKILIRSVDPDFRGNRLSSAALERAMKMAKERGFSSIVSETSSFYTRQGFLNRGGESRGNINYKTWTNEAGKTPFKHAPEPHEGLYLMEIKL